MELVSVAMEPALVFSEGTVVMTAEVDAVAPQGASQGPVETPLQQCINSIGKYQPRGFLINVGHVKESKRVKLEVTIFSPLMEEIPLLADLPCNPQDENMQKKKRQKTENSEGSALEEKTSIPFPHSILGLISVLLLHEELVTAEAWLGDLAPPKCSLRDPKFAIEMFQVADFLDLEGVREKVVGWLQALLHNVAKQERVSLDSNVKCGMVSNGEAIAYNMDIAQVLQSILQHNHFCIELLQPLTEDVRPEIPSVVDLPEEVLCMWLRCQGPTLDFSEFRLTSAQWVKLLHCVVAARLPVVALEVGPVDSGKECFYEQYHTRDFIHGQRSILQALWSVCVSLGGLKYLHLTELPIHASHVPLLGRILQSVSGSLEELGLRGFRMPCHGMNSYDLRFKQKFFEAIAQLPLLKTLVLPEWSDFALAGRSINKPWSEEQLKQVMSPLSRLPVLQKVVVCSVDGSLPFTAEPSLVGKFSEW